MLFSETEAKKICHQASVIWTRTRAKSCSTICKSKFHCSIFPRTLSTLSKINQQWCRKLTISTSCINLWWRRSNLSGQVPRPCSWWRPLSSRITRSTLSNTKQRHWASTILTISSSLRSKTTLRTSSLLLKWNCTRNKSGYFSMKQTLIKAKLKAWCVLITKYSKVSFTTLSGMRSSSHPRALKSRSSSFSSLYDPWPLSYQGI